MSQQSVTVTGDGSGDDDRMVVDYDSDVTNGLAVEKAIQHIAILDLAMALPGDPAYSASAMLREEA